MVIRLLASVYTVDSTPFCGLPSLHKPLLCFDLNQIHHIYCVLLAMPNFNLMEAKMIVFMASKEEQKQAIVRVRSFNSPDMGSTTAVDYVMDRSLVAETELSQG